MVTWNLKSCPRCGGDVYIDRDAQRQLYQQCLQCSYGGIIIEKKIPDDSNQSLDNLLNNPLLDKNIEILEALAHGKQPLVVRDIYRLFDELETTIDTCLQKMEKYSYVSKIKSYEQAKSDKFGITAKGMNVVQDYWNLMNKIEDLKLNGNGSNGQLNTYELVDEDGELTSFGRYAIKTSKNLSSFVEEIYWEASKISEAEEVPEKVLVGISNS